MRIHFVWPGITLPGFASLKMGGSNEAVYMNHGLAMLSGVLKKAGHDCYTNDLRSYQSWETFEAEIKEQQFDLTLIGFHSVDKDAALKVCGIIKHYFPTKPIIVGGPHVTIAQEKELQNVDCIVWGEGEITILELLKDLKHLPKLISGIPVDDLDSLPLVDREFINSEFEKNSPLLPLLPVPFYTINIGRGCPYSCRFCHQSGENPIFTKKWRVRSVGSVLDEIRTIKVGTGRPIGSLMFHDDLFPSKKWCEEYIDKIGERIPFWCQMRSDFIVSNESLIEGLTEVGLTWVSLGVESGSQRMLDFLNKKSTVELNKQAIEILHRNKVNIFANIIFGVPTETKEDIDLSGKLIQESKFSWLSLSTYTCYPGSDLYKYCVDKDLFLDEHYSMIRYPYERKIKGIDYTYLFSKLAEFGQYKGELRQYTPKAVFAVKKRLVKELEFNIQPSSEIKVSIILTSHNRPEFLIDAINSIFKQTIPDWELLIVDDFSTDTRVLDVLEKAKKDPRVKAFRTNYDVDNISVLWNLMLDKAEGQYIAFLDDDNCKSPSFCEEMFNYLDARTKFDAVACFNKVINEDNPTESVFDAPKYVNKQNILQMNYIDSGCMIIRSTLKNRIGWFDERLVTHEDWDYVIRIIHQGLGFGIIEKPLAIYRWHKENRMLRSESLGMEEHLKIVKAKNYINKLKLLLFHQDEDKITLSQNNVLRGINDALQSLDYIDFESISVSNFDKITTKYDVILCFAPFCIDIIYIKALKKFSDEVVSFHIEDPQALGTNLERVKYFTYIFTNDKSVISRYEEIIGRGNVGFCPSISVNSISLKFRDDIDKKHDVIFYGYAYDSRIKFIQELYPKIRQLDVKFVAVGGNWQGKNVPYIDELSEQESIQIMEESKIVILHNRKNTDLGGDQRSILPVSVVRGYFECASNSVIMLDDDRLQHSFKDEVVFYSDVDDLLKKVQHYLSSTNESKEIAIRAKKRALNDFTYIKRINYLVNAVRSKRFYCEVT